MKRRKYFYLLIACMALAVVPGACGPRITNIQVTQARLQKTDSPPIILPITVNGCPGRAKREKSFSTTLEQEITVGTIAKTEGGAEVKISEAVQASLSAAISNTYQQNFSTISTQMDKFTFEVEENKIATWEIKLWEHQARSIVSYTVPGLFSDKTYFVPYAYTLYMPDMDVGSSISHIEKCPGIVEVNGEEGNVADVELPVLHIEAEGYSEKSAHVDTTDCSEGGRLLGWINNGEWVNYEHVNFGSGGYKTFQARVASAEQGGEIDIRLDSTNGQSIGVCQVPATGGWQNWRTITCNINDDVTGERKIYLLFRGQGEYLYNINWIEFSQ